MNEISLRAPKSDEFLKFLEIKKRAFSEMIEKTWGKWDDEIQEKFLREDFSDPSFRGIEIGGNLVGMIQIFETKSEIRVRNIYIDPDFQGQGIGHAIFSDLQERRKQISLEVLEINARARKFYENLGFKYCDGAKMDFHLKMFWEKSVLNS
jgi:ribosomal protein S18 acetylase RimI-like enzyme